MQELEFIMGFRLEDKIKFHISDYIKIKNEIFKLNGRSLYPKRFISSLYFDNKNLDMYRDSEEGNTPRKKIRFRNYPDAKSKKFFYEVKINSAEGKFKKSSEKTYDQFKIAFKDGLYDSTYGILEKKIQVSYFREYFLVQGTRLTLDYKINYSSPDGFNKKDDIESLILEVKSSKNIIDIQNKFLNIIPIKRERVSKYCEGIDCLFNKHHLQRLNYAI